MAKVKVLQLFLDNGLLDIDLPRAVRSYYDKGLKFFGIEHKYLIEGEPTGEECTAKGAIVKVGRNSGRLYAIEINLAAVVQATGSGVPPEMNVSDLNELSRQVAGMIQASIRTLATDPERTRRELNYNVAGEAISENEPKLMAELVPA